MNKMEYRRPEADLVIFENEDIITTSWWTTKCTSGVGENRTDICDYGGSAKDRLENQIAVNRCMVWHIGSDEGTWDVRSANEWGNYIKLCPMLFKN